MTELTYSNMHGYFTIETESKGKYVLRVRALGYEPTDQFVSVTNREKVVISDILVTPKDNEETTRIVGQITDQDNNIIPLAEVILYSVAEYGGMVPVGYQKTDVRGNYEFNFVPNGTYKVCLKVR